MATTTKSEFSPVVLSLDFGLTPRAVLRRLSHLPYTLLLESTLVRGDLGRYSFCTADPVKVEQIKVGEPSPLAAIKASLAELATSHVESLPPFQGGWAGLLSYELGHCFETLAQVSNGPIELPALVMGLYDFVIAWDHCKEKSWLICQGFPATGVDERSSIAQRRCESITSLLNSSKPDLDLGEFQKQIAERAPFNGFKKLAAEAWSNFDEQEYHTAVERAVEYINAGDIFQTNLSQQLLLPATHTSLELYEDLARVNPSTFAGYFNLGETQVLSSSPERLVRVAGRSLETRPIKGTRRRTKIPMVDIAVRNELEQNEKERAENTMIVDLMRNDFSRICDDRSVLVTQWCSVESYESVYHLVSAICGELLDGLDATDVVAAIFPGGSVTGAPKIRAMEIISELEGVARGAYCGSLGYFGVNGQADFNILIRTVTIQNGWWQIPVGGAIVSQSTAAQEYAETWTKASAILQACLFGQNDSQGRVLARTPVSQMGDS